jgi:hypothetical protein
MLSHVVSSLASKLQTTKLLDYITKERSGKPDIRALSPDCDSFSVRFMPSTDEEIY